MDLTLEVVYGDAAALAHDAETQLGRGGLFVAADASALPPLAELTLRLVVGGRAAQAAARLTVASAQAACVEIAAAALPALLAEVRALVGDAAPRAGERTARIYDAASAVAASAASAPSADAAAAASAEAASAAAASADVASAAAASADAAADDDAPAGHAARGDTRGQLGLDRRIAAMSIGEKVQLALHGNRDARALLMRERAGVVQASLIRNVKVTLDEIQALARSPMLAPDAAETLAQHPSYGLSPQVALALVRNPRTPLPIATQMLARLQPSDLRAVAKGVGVRTQVAVAARKRLLDPPR